ncbi:MAG: hypothetical protein ACJAWL_001592, partial [Motiliproteus sp.]
MISALQSPQLIDPGTNPVLEFQGSVAVVDTDGNLSPLLADTYVRPGEVLVTGEAGFLTLAHAYGPIEIGPGC